MPVPRLDYARVLPPAAPPKVMARPELIVEVGRGAHGIDTTRTPVRLVDAVDLLILDISFTTEARFASKLVKVRERLAQWGHRFTEDEAAHWKAWLALEETGN